MSFEDSFLASTFDRASDDFRFSREKDLNENYRRVQLQESRDTKEAQLDLNSNFRQNRQRLLDRTQIGTAIPGSCSLIDLEDINDDSDLSEFETELEKMGILVRMMDGEKVFYTGHLTNAEVVDKLNSDFNRDIDKGKCSRFERLTRDFLLDDLNWDVITLPMQSELGVQDTFLKALLLSRQFQHFAFRLLMSKMDKIGTNSSCTRDDKEFGNHLVSHIRYLDKVYSTRALLSLVFDRNIHTWISPLREAFVSALPEIFMDQSMHQEVLLNVLDFLKPLSKNCVGLRRAAVKAMTQLAVGTPASLQKIRTFLLSNLMSFEAVVVKDIVGYLIHSIRPDEKHGFRNMLVQIRVHLDFSALQKSADDFGTMKKVDDYLGYSAESVDHVVYGIFDHILNFFRVNVSKTMRDVQACLAWNTKKGLPTHPVPPSDMSTEQVVYEIDSDEEFSEATLDANIDGVDDSNCSAANTSKRELELFDILLILAIQSVKPDSRFFLNLFKSQLTQSSRHLNALLNNLEKALAFRKFNVVFLANILKVGYDLLCTAEDSTNNDLLVKKKRVDSQNKRAYMNKMSTMGVIVYKQLFENVAHKRKDILNKLLTHLNVFHAESAACLTILERIAEADVSSLLPFQPTFLEMLDHFLSMLSTENSRRLLFLLVKLNLRRQSVVADCSSSCSSNSQLQGQLGAKLDAYLKADCSQQQKVWGVLGLLMYTKALLTVFEGEADNRRAVEQQVQKTLNKLLYLTKGCYPVRAEFFSQLRLLVSEQESFSPSLNSFGTRLFGDFRRDYFNQHDDYVPKGGFEAAKYINTNCSLWLPINSLIYSPVEQPLDGPILQLIPLLLLLREFAHYEFEFHYDSVNSELCSNKFIFLLEANLSFAKPGGDDNQSTLQRCHMLYFAVEWLRTVLNMFSDCDLEHLFVNELMMKKFDLLVECQAHLVQSVKKLRKYTLPDLTKQLVRPAKGLQVHFQESASMRRLRHKALQLNQPNATNEPEFEELDVDGPGGTGHSESFCVVQLQANKRNEQKARKNSISVDKLVWSYTPFTLNTLGRLLTLMVEWTRRKKLGLIENLVVLLRQLFSTSKYLPKQVVEREKWSIICKLLPSLFDTLMGSMHNLQQSSEQDTPDHYEDHLKEMKDMLEFTLQAFCLIIKNRDLQPSICGEDVGESFSTLGEGNSTRDCPRRVQKLLVILFEQISKHNLSTQPMHIETTIFDESSEGVDKEVVIMDSFLKIGHLMPTIQAAAALLGILSSFRLACTTHSQQTAELALSYLAKQWFANHQDYQFSQKQLVEITGSYLDLRPQIERLTALHWLTVHQLNTVVEEQSHKNRHIFVVDTLVERGELVHKYSGMHWPAFNPTTFASIHKFLFSQLNEFVGKSLCTASDLWLTTPQMVIYWRTAIQCYIYLLVSTRVKELLSVPLLANCVRAGRKFMSFICSKESSFMSLLDKGNIRQFAKVIPSMLKELQSGNRLVHNIVVQAKTRKYPALLKLAPSLRATSELFLRKIRRALMDAGLAEAISIVDGQNCDSMDQTTNEPEATGNQRKRRAP